MNMRRWYRISAVCTMLCTGCISSISAQLGECKWVHGRAHMYTGDGQLRIWHVGTKHDFEPDSSTWPRVNDWLEQGIRPQDKLSLDTPVGSVYLFGDFLLCPTQPYRPGAVQAARILSVRRRHYSYEP